MPDIEYEEYHLHVFQACNSPTFLQFVCCIEATAWHLCLFRENPSLTQTGERSHRARVGISTPGSGKQETEKLKIKIRKCGRCPGFKVVEIAPLYGVEYVLMRRWETTV